ncbi:MATE family efflux transporter [Lactobacillus delbrueckii]|uniref:MATE family efflux transporter n=1 Tax=Lactobacillus delbrueckii TaxID=1584 RepID=UPI00222196D3|nr:MATE family efflux transporter [Lactobacillus delbrueckii]UYX13695.1 MATE family efflux transporter [Lactobacillus delbrueckii]
MAHRSCRDHCLCRPDQFLPVSLIALPAIAGIFCRKSNLGVIHVQKQSTIDLTSGSISLGLVKFALPLMAGNVLQQCYNLTDTLVVGRFIGKNALAAVGSAYTLMIFLTSIILGLSMGCGAFLSQP